MVKSVIEGNSNMTDFEREKKRSGTEDGINGRVLILFSN